MTTKIDLKSKKIVDVACGSKMFWFDKNNYNTLYCDNRQLTTELYDGRVVNINPDIICDFTNLPFDDESFHLVVFDPPHLLRAGKNSWLAAKYGTLDTDWRKNIEKGFEECWRIFKQNGTLVFKWNEEQIPLKQILKLINQKPLFGNVRHKTHWLVFFKEK